MVVGPFQENTFLIGRQDAPETILIDPGEEADRIAAFIESKGWKPTAIVNTHGHLDHIGAVEPLRKRFTIPFYLHSAEIPLMKRAPEHAALYGVPPPEVPRVDHRLEEYATLELGGLAMKILLVPGHTPGGVGILIGERLFAGDTLFLGSVGRTDLPGGNSESLIQSIRDRFLVLPGGTTVHCGHGPDTTIDRERSSNPFLTGLWRRTNPPA